VFHRTRTVIRSASEPSGRYAGWLNHDADRPTRPSSRSDTDVSVSSSFATQQAADADTWGHVEDLLELARRHLGMELAWLSEFSDGRQMIRVASGDAAGMNVNVGSGSCLEDSYCARVLAGTLPATIPDARRNLVTRGLAVTHELGIGSYVGVPWHGSDGEPAGMLCCLSPGTSPGLDERAARFLASIAEVVSNRVTGSLTQRRRAGVTDHIQTILQQRQVRMVFQPVVRLRDGAVLSYEALARFDDPVFPTPAHAFAAATHVGLGVELEHLAVREALAQLDDVPDSCFLAVNLSAEAMIDPEVQRTLLTHAGRRIGVELTEHVRVADYTELVAGAERLRSAGIQLAVDDAGAGFASFSHILRLRPAHPCLGRLLTRHRRPPDRGGNRDPGGARRPARPGCAAGTGLPHREAGRVSGRTPR
jgi:hypothetical protein